MVAVATAGATHPCRLTLVKMNTRLTGPAASTRWLLLTPQDPVAEVTLGFTFISSYFCQGAKRRG